MDRTALPGSGLSDGGGGGGEEWTEQPYLVVDFLTEGRRTAHRTACRPQTETQHQCCLGCPEPPLVDSWAKCTAQGNTKD